MTHVAHGMHSMRSAEPGFKARAVTGTSCASHLGTLATAHLLGALAVSSAALAMNSLSILRVRSCPA